jgi:hypothetical protein
MVRRGRDFPRQDPAALGMARRDREFSGLGFAGTRRDRARHILARRVQTWSGRGRGFPGRDLACRFSTRHGAASQCEARSFPGHGEPRPGMGQTVRGTAGCGIAGLYSTRQGRGFAWLGGTCRGGARRGKAPHCAPWQGRDLPRQGLAVRDPAGLHRGKARYGMARPRRAGSSQGEVRHGAARRVLARQGFFRDWAGRDQARYGRARQVSARSSRGKARLGVTSLRVATRDQAARGGARRGLALLNTAPLGREFPSRGKTWLGMVRYGMSGQDEEFPGRDKTRRGASRSGAGLTWLGTATQGWTWQGPGASSSAVEQRTFNPRDVGSTPTGPTHGAGRGTARYGVARRGKSGSTTSTRGLWCKEAPPIGFTSGGGVGSNPTRSTRVPAGLGLARPHEAGSSRGLAWSDEAASRHRQGQPVQGREFSGARRDGTRLGQAHPGPASQVWTRRDTARQGVSEAEQGSTWHGCTRQGREFYLAGRGEATRDGAWQVLARRTKSPRGWSSQGEAGIYRDLAGLDQALFGSAPHRQCSGSARQGVPRGRDGLGSTRRYMAPLDQEGRGFTRLDQARMDQAGQDQGSARQGSLGARLGTARPDRDGARHVRASAWRGVSWCG